MATIKHIKVREDATGVEALVEHEGFTFAFNTLGEITSRLISPAKGSIVENLAAFTACYQLYQIERNKLVDADWLRRNAEIYATCI